MPLWLSIPVVFALWVSCWISSMDPTGSRADNTLLWIATAVGTALLVRSAALRFGRPF
jgi:hypothetical protein